MSMYGKKSTDIACGPGVTKQSFKDECDIHTIMQKYHATGLLTHLSASRPMYGDFTSVPDYQTALNRVNFANDEFAKLPAKMRERFHNDPVELLKFLENPENRKEAVDLGILKAEKVENVTPGDGGVQEPAKAEEPPK